MAKTILLSIKTFAFLKFLQESVNITQHNSLSRYFDINGILNKYTERYPDADDLDEYTEYVNDMSRAELEVENTLIPN